MIFPFSCTPWGDKNYEYLTPLENGLFLKPFSELKWLKFDALENELAMHAKAKQILPNNVPGVVGIFQIDEKEWVYVQEAVMNALTINDYLVKHFEDMDYLVDQIRTLIDTLNKNGLNHNDLHGGNIMVDNDKKVWIIDFGLSSLSTEPETILEIAIERPKKKREIYEIDLTREKETIKTTEKCKHPHLRHYVKTNKKSKTYKYLNKMKTEKSKKILETFIHCT